MTENDFKKQWNKHKRKSRATQTQQHLPIEKREKQIKEELTYFKDKLKKSLEKNSILETKKNLKKIINLRKKQMGLELEKKKEYYLAIHEDDWEEEVKKYIFESMLLIKAVSKKISQKNA